MAGRERDHWLWRLSAAEWLAAARGELEQGRGRVDNRRAAVTHSRRAAGMALNGVLVVQVERGWAPRRSESIWGRSYIDHLRALADPSASAELLAPFADDQAGRCRALLAISVMPAQGLVRLARGKHEAAEQALDLAGEIVEACAEIIERRPRGDA